MRNVETDFYIMATVPPRRRELIQRRNFVIVGRAVPGIKKVAAPTVRRKQHVCESLAARVAIKSRVAKADAQKLVGPKIMKIRNADRNAFLVVVRRRRLRNERPEVGELRAHWENIDVHIQHVLGRKNRLKAR